MSIKKLKQPKENMVVDFNTLDEDNKTEFLEFLLKNNITFQKGDHQKHDNFVAKVSIDNKGILKPTQSNKKATPTNASSKKIYKAIPSKSQK